MNLLWLPLLFVTCAVLFLAWWAAKQRFLIQRESLSNQLKMSEHSFQIAEINLAQASLRHEEYLQILTNLSSATNLAAARTSQEAVVFSSIGSTDLPEVYHLEDDEDDEPTHYMVDDMTEGEMLMSVIEPDYAVTRDFD